MCDNFMVSILYTFFFCILIHTCGEMYKHTSTLTIALYHDFKIVISFEIFNNIKNSANKFLEHTSLHTFPNIS